MAGKLQIEGVRHLLTRLKEYFVQIKDAVKSVNGNEPDENGDIAINSVPYADNLQSSLAQQNYDTFIERTSGGSASIQDGDAWLMTAKGTYTHEGFVPEVLTMTVNAETSGITATINRDTFVSYVSESGTTTLTYTSAWDADPANYGITVTGTPVDGDTITVVYVKEVRGTITQTTPLTFVSTGWNLYNPETGYAKVIKYSDEYGFYISGAYTALSFSGTISGTQTVITPTDGFFTVPSDGYVWVTGGEALTTAIRMTHSDFDPNGTQAYEHDDYTESVIDLTDFMGTNFPNGLLAVGTVQDEINLNIMQAYSRVIRMTYSDANLAEARASGRQYEYDENYIYLERAEAQAISITNHPGGGYTADDHGMEFWTGTELPVETHIVYGNNLKNRLERDVVTKSQDVINRLDFYDVTGVGQFKALGASMGKVLNDNITNNTWRKLASGYTSGVNANDYTTPGFYHVGISTNSPYGTNIFYGVLIVFTGNEGHCQQIALSAHNGNMYIRGRNSTSAVWSTWDKIPTGYYEQGKQYTVVSEAYGYVTNNTKTMFLDISFPKGLPRTPTITKLNIVVRGIQGYVDTFTEDKDVFAQSAFSVTSLVRHERLLRVVVEKAIALTNVVNNTPIVVQVNNITFTA